MNGGFPYSAAHVHETHSREFSEATKTFLKVAFQADRFPSAKTRRLLASQLGLTHRQIQVWFQNRRQRQRKGDSGCVLRQAVTDVAHFSHFLPPLRTQPLVPPPLVPPLALPAASAHGPAPLEGVLAVPLPDAAQTFSNTSTTSTATATPTATPTATATPSPALPAAPSIACPSVAIQAILASDAAGPSLSHPSVSHPSVASPSVAGPCVAGREPAQMDTFFQAAPPHSILWADDQWLAFCGFRLAEVLGKPMGILQVSQAGRQAGKPGRQAGRQAGR